MLLMLLFYELELVFVVGWLLLLGGSPNVNLLLLLSLSFVWLFDYENVEAIHCHSVESNVVLEGRQGLFTLFVSGIVSPSVVL